MGLNPAAPAITVGYAAYLACAANPVACGAVVIGTALILGVAYCIATDCLGGLRGASVVDHAARMKKYAAITAGMQAIVVWALDEQAKDAIKKKLAQKKQERDTLRDLEEDINAGRLVPENSKDPKKDIEKLIREIKELIKDKTQEIEDLLGELGPQGPQPPAP